jgi:plastocyanin
MRSLRSALLALVATLVVCALGAAPAQAATVVIDSIDPVSGPAFMPANVTIDPGDTVRFEFDEATTTHTVTSTSANWSINETRDPNGAPIERTFDTLGTYTFVCTVHAGMSGSITVASSAPTLTSSSVVEKVYLAS